MGLLRIILALAVVIAHSGSIFGYKSTGGIIAVEIFLLSLAFI
jgi:peptidoglycan/LPS O-acetylase OafA/YrhL